MAERTIKLTGDLEAFVDAQVECGAYATPEDVVRAGLEALRVATHDVAEAWTTDGRPISREKLRAMIDEGIADLEAGRIHTYEKPGDLAKDIKREGRRLFRERQEKLAGKSASSSAPARGETSRKSTPGSQRRKTS